MRRRTLSLVLVVSLWSLLSDAGLAAPGPVATHNVSIRDWTLKTRWGPVGLFSITSTDQDHDSNLNAGRDGYLQICVGPLGNVTVTLDNARAVGQWRTLVPALFAAGFVVYVVRSRRRSRAPQHERADPESPVISPGTSG